MSRAQKRRDEKHRRMRMSRNGGLLVPGVAELPKTQVLLLQLLQQNQVIMGLLEVLCRQGFGQSAEDVEKAQGVSFPIGPSKEELIGALQEEMDRLSVEEATAAVLPFTEQLDEDHEAAVETTIELAGEEPAEEEA